MLMLTVSATAQPGHKQPNKIMIIQGHGIRLDTELIKKMELHEHRELVIMYFTKHGSRELGELKISFDRKEDAVNFYEKIRTSDEARLDEVSVMEYSVDVNSYYYERYVEEELKLKKSIESYIFR